MPGQHQGIDMRSPEEREKEKEGLAPLVREALEAEEREKVRITDKRGQGTRQSVPVEPSPVLSEDDKAKLAAAMAEQGAAAEGEQQAEPAVRCAAFVIVSISHTGVMRLHHEPDEISDVVHRGIAAERPANSADLMNMVNQLRVMVDSNEVSSRVLDALNTQAQAAMARAAGARIATPAMPGVAQGRQV